MRKIAFLLLVSALALRASALVRTENVIGVLAVESTSAETVVSVPWVAAENGAEADIAVSNLVVTKGLNVGDRLAYYHAAAGRYEVWVLEGDDAGGLIWNAAPNVDASGLFVPTNRLARGNALILTRNEPIAERFYLSGQVSVHPAQTNVLARSLAAETFSLLAPPTDCATSPNAGEWSNVAAGDALILRGKAFSWNGSAWGTSSFDPQTFSETFTPMTETIPAGQGAWYRSAKGAMPATVVWTNLPSFKQGEP